MPDDYKCPPVRDPAQQPTNPLFKCKKLEEPKGPDFEEPKQCRKGCTCPPGTETKKDCLEKLIDGQTQPITDGDKAKAFKAELEQLLTKARAASQEYTLNKYQTLLEQWKKQDCEIAELIRKLVCAVPCWKCVLECHVCTLLYEFKYAEERLYGGLTPPPKVRNLQELHFWQTQDKAAKERTFLRIKGVLTAWEKPAQTIEKVLADNAKLISDICKTLCTDPSKAIFDVFLKLVPLHLAIAPPEESEVITKIEKQYTQLCLCDTGGNPDDCCGPNVGELSWLARIIGPQPYLIKPEQYFDVICCLAKHRYQEAKDQLSRAEAVVANTQTRINRNKALIENGPKTFEKDAKGAIPAVINCNDYKPIPDKPDCKPDDYKKDDYKPGDKPGEYEPGGYKPGGDEPSGTEGSHA